MAAEPLAWVERSISAVRTTVRGYRKIRDRSFTPDGKWLVGVGMVLGIFSLDVLAHPAYVFWSGLFGIGLAALAVGRTRRILVEVERKLPLRVTAGARVDYPVLVRNTAGWAQSDLEVREEDLPWEIEPELDEGRGPLIRRLAPGETRRITLSARFTRRGIFDLPALRVERTDPLGLTRGGRSHWKRSQVIVHPEHFPIERVDFSTARIYQPGGVPLSASLGESTEFVGLRDYRAGDPLRHISWKAWARTGEPVVREFQGEYYRRVAIVLDTRVRPGPEEDDHFESAVSTTASLTRYFETHEYVIDLFAAGPRVFYMQAGTGLGRMEDVLDLLACVGPGRGDRLPSVDDRLRQLAGRLSGLVLVTTDWWSESRDFHVRLAGEVPEIKVVLVRAGAPSLDPAADIADPRLYRRVDPALALTGVEEL
jgi:uncharacterized protein (DUF58 family)